MHNANFFPLVVESAIFLKIQSQESLRQFRPQNSLCRSSSPLQTTRFGMWVPISCIHSKSKKKYAGGIFDCFQVSVSGIVRVSGQCGLVLGDLSIPWQNSVMFSFSLDFVSWLPVGKPSPLLSEFLNSMGCVFTLWQLLSRSLFLLDSTQSYGSSSLVFPINCLTLSDVARSVLCIASDLMSSVSCLRSVLGSWNSHRLIRRIFPGSSLFKGVF